MNPPRSAEWIVANQRRLAAEFGRLRKLLGEADTASTESPPPSASPDPAPSAIDRIATAFDLSKFEQAILLLAAGVEMDEGLAALVPRPSFGLALDKLPSAHWSAFAPLAPLRGWRLVEIDPGSPIQGRLRIDERLLHALAGVEQIDARLQPLLREHAAPGLMAEAHRQHADRLADAVVRNSLQTTVVQLAGDDAEGQRDCAAEIAARLGRGLFVLAQADVPSTANEQDALAVLWQREALLLPAALLIDTHQTQGTDGSQAAGGSHLSRFVARLGGLVFVAAREPVGVPAGFHARIDKPDGDGQRSLWTQAFKDSASSAELRTAIEAVASQFRLPAGAIARRAAAWQGAPDLGPLAAELWRECCEEARPRLEALAQRIPPAAGWSDLVLPEAQLAVLHQLAAQVRQRIRVYADWGFGSQGTRGLGISALFVGESGTGKTMACEVLARELDLDLYRIDLSSVVSKYIGETEKNLRSVFDAAEDSGALLLFDEADALFGKRSEVKDSHDRYANIEVGYLLQRMESYRGLAVLTTNQRAALDPAFLRRLRFVVHFPFPDRAQREAIWRGVFPAAMPRETIDYAGLARVPMAGGHIRNIALNAAFLAAGSDGSLAMAHLLRAAHQEAAKHERPLAEAQTRGWVQ